MNQHSSPSLVSNIANTITINTNDHLGSSMISDGISEPSSPDSSFDASELIGPGSIADNVTSQLVQAGPVGVAAAAAIASVRKKRRPHIFEINPSIRKRQQTRLLRKLKACIEEYTTRIGQQAVVLCCTPCKTSNMNSYKVFGSQPLENVVKNCKSMILAELDVALAEQAPPNNETQGLYELPPLALDGMPTPIDKMTQAQLRTFIPEMLKYSTERSKPGWGKPECRPIWWPNDVPWVNVRSDVRTDEEKKRLSWTEALRAIVKNCYKHHGREDLLNIFGGEIIDNSTDGQFTGTMVQTINNPDGTLSIIQIDTGSNSLVTLPDGTQATVVHSALAQKKKMPITGQFTRTMVQTINNPDGTLSIIQIDTGSNSLVTLPDGTQATVVHSALAMQPDAQSQQDINTTQMQPDAQSQQDINTTQASNGSVQLAPMQPDAQSQQDINTTQASNGSVQLAPVSMEMAEGADSLMQPDAQSQQDINTTQASNGSVQLAPVSIEMAEGADSLASLGGGRIMLSSTDAAQISTDPTTGLMTIPVSMYQNLLATNNGIEISHSALSQLQQQQQQILTPQYVQSTQPGAGDQLTVTQGLQEMQTDLMDHQTLQEIQDPNQNITVRVVSLEPKSEPS